MGFLGLPVDIPFLENLDLGAFVTGLGKVALAVLIFGFIAIVTGIVYWRLNKKQKYDKRIFWFEEVSGHMVPVGEDRARELVIPNTNVAVFYIPKKDLYLPRGTKKMGKEAYWYCIRNNREIVNFSMTNLNEDMEKAGLNYDHTDMRYAKENLLELIKRNYREKTQVWWKEYKDVIATVVFIFVMSLAFFFLLSKISALIGSVESLIDTTQGLIKAAELKSGSGVAAA